jgi:hypothetical protein
MRVKAQADPKWTTSGLARGLSYLLSPRRTPAKGPTGHTLMTQPWRRRPPLHTTARTNSSSSSTALPAPSRPRPPAHCFTSCSRPDPLPAGERCQTLASVMDEQSAGRAEATAT